MEIYSTVLIVSLSTIGIVQWLKNWVKGQYALLALFVLILNVTFQLAFVSPAITWGWNLFTLSLSFMQLGHGALVKVPETIIERIKL